VAGADDLIVELKSAFESGASATPLRVAIEAMCTLPLPEASRVTAVVSSHVDVAIDAVSAAARGRLLTSLPPRPEDPLDSENYDRLKAALSRDAPQVTAGEVNALLAAPGRYLAGEALGAMHSLVVAKDNHGGGAPLKHHAGDDLSLIAGFVAGSDAARHWIISRLTENDGLVERLVYGFNFVGDLPSLRMAAVGESLGLAAAVGSVSAVLDVPVPEGLAFTGRIDARGRLYPVSNIEAKLRAAADDAVTDVYLPRGCTFQNPYGVTVHACSHLGEVVDSIFPTALVVERLNRIRALRPAVMPIRHWESSPPGAPKARALITMVGGSDPIGTWKTRDGTSTTTQEDGPILAACRELQPAVVLLFYTTADGNDYSSKAKAVKDTIDELYRESEVTLFPLPEALDDPTDMEALYDAFRKAAEPIAASVESRCSCFLNLSSGPPQVQVVLALLHMTGIFHGTMIQVRESRRSVKDGQPRIRRVVLPSPRLDVI
jgi:hypothetical protein